ncbi:hypothetical protein V6N11_067808 [Hibiscus sabdariffa]|uniref:RNase H type-1 domain-containing protein n=1 Tax=Hibiscus sabdariffa TaxID=183260 RepID=A0ABR2SS83_9ROSI
MNLMIAYGFVSDMADWDVLFGYLVWSLWLRRNEVVFTGEQVRIESIIFRAMHMTQEYIAHNSNGKPTTSATLHGSHDLVHWERLSLGFSRRLGCCSVVEVEIWDIFEGLSTAWSISIQKLIVEIDNLEAIKLLQGYVHGASTFTLIPHVM